MDSTGEPAEQGHNSAPVDLTNDAALVRLLLGDTRAWRQRLTEELTFGAYDVVRVRSQYQVEITSGLLLEHGLVREPPGRIRAILPLSTRPKASLLAFNVSGPDGAPARLLQRRDIAAFEAEYLMELWESGPVEVVAPDEGLLEAITGFHAGRFRLTRAEEVLEDEGLARYLSASLPFAVPLGWVRHWRTELRDLPELLATALGERPNTSSAAENPIFALASRVPRPHDLDEAEALLSDYASKLRAADVAGDAEFLEALAEYGRRWEVLIETDVPLDQPVVVTLAEDRVVEFRRRMTSVHLALGDAASYHMEARLSDHAVEFGPAAYRGLDGKRIMDSNFEDLQSRQHALVLYTSRPEREYYGELHVKLRLAQDHRLGSWLVLSLVALALVVATFGAAPESIDALALLTVPTTFAAAVVLTRTESPLEARLGRPLRRTLACLVFALWAVALTQLSAGELGIGSSPGPSQPATVSDTRR